MPEVRGFPLIHDKTVDEWGTQVRGYFMTGPPAIASNATRKEIDQRYRDLCNVWHPDRFQYNDKLRETATKEFQEMQEAFPHIRACPLGAI
jgi:CHASE3 domain sensor protein